MSTSRNVLVNTMFLGAFALGVGLVTAGASRFVAMFSKDEETKVSSAKATTCGRALASASAGAFVLATVAGVASGTFRGHVCKATL